MNKFAALQGLRVRALRARALRARQRAGLLPAPHRRSRRTVAYVRRGGREEEAVMALKRLINTQNMLRWNWDVHYELQSFKIYETMTV